MKKFNSQAELLSRPDGAPRASPADCDFLIDHKQNDTATGAELHALHLRSVIFFLFIHRLQAQAHSRGLLVPRGSRASDLKTWFFLIDYRRKHHAPRSSRA